MGMYLLDRFNGVRWQTMAAAPTPIDPFTYAANDRTFPYDPKRPAFAGDPGYKARVRFVDVTTDMELELYEWKKTPINPRDPDSDLEWGWECVKRATYPSHSPIQNMKVNVSW